MKSCRNIRAVRVGLLVGTVALWVCAAPRAAAQEEKYQQAIEAKNNAKMEDACNLFQQVASATPNFKNVQAEMKMACNEKKRAYDLEEKWFKQGVDLFSQGPAHYDEARGNFEKAGRIPLNHPKYRDQINQYLRRMEAQEAGERLFKEAVDLFGQGNLPAAQSKFRQVANSGGPHAQEANQYLQRISEKIAEKNAQEGAKKGIAESNQAFQEGERLYKRHKREEARAHFERVIQGPNVDSARRYIARIERESAAPPTTNPPPHGQGGGTQIVQQGGSTSEPLLREGLKAYLSGDYAKAEDSLSSYLNGKPSNRALAFFFRGAAHSARYFLAGEKDSGQKDQALADFRKARTEDAQFAAPEKFVSPKIVALFAEARP